MPVFDVQTSDGRKFQVDAPDIQSASTALQSYAPKQQASPSMTAGLGRSFSEGVPILGGLVNKAEAATEAAAAPYVEPLLDTLGVGQPGERINAPTFGERYKKALNIQEGMDESFAKAHPVAETAAEIAGGVASTGALATTGLGAKALGLSAKTLPGMIAAGGASGLTVGAIDEATRGGDPVTGAAVGGLAGIGGPVVGRAIGTVAEPIARTWRGFRDPEGEAAKRVAAALNRDIQSGNAGLKPSEFHAANAAGTPVSIMDMGGETTRSLARSSANTSPEGRATLTHAIDARFETQGGRLTDWLNSSLHYPEVSSMKDAIDNVAKTVNRPAYAKAFAQGSKGLWSPELERLSGSDAVSNAMQGAIKNAKDEAIISGYGAMNPRITFTEDGRIQFTKGPTGVPTYPDLQFWDLTRRQLSDAAMEAKPGSSKARQLKSFATSLNAELDKLVPSYADARAGAAKFFGAQDALEAGQMAVTSTMKNDQIAAGLAKMSPMERKIFQDGFVGRYVQSVLEKSDRRSILNQVARSPAARQRLVMALGPQRANELEAMLRVEGIMDRARTAVQGNSTTVRQLAELGLAGGVNFYEGKGSFTTDPEALAKTLMIYGAARGSRTIDERVAQHVARLLASSNIKDLDKGIKIVSKNKTLMNAIRNVDAAIGAVGVRGTAATLDHKMNDKGRVFITDGPTDNGGQR
jgi:hypothetical protein